MRLIIAFVLALVALPLSAQDQVQPADLPEAPGSLFPTDDVFIFENDFVEEEPIVVEPLPLDEFGGMQAELPDLWAADQLDEDGMAAMQQSLRAYYEYRASGYDHRRRVFEWQLLSSKVIFFLVIGIVVAGLYFSWLQFAEARRATDEKRGSLETSFEAGTGGIKVSSPVLGIIILAISLAFFYLYLTHVYPITEVL
ncbi:hypothetical protein SAMN05421688_2263 [Poseidonocella pacifica]|uniref:Uncharacterized protein n=1 Tax=Poseidonocella pacifica TaxID=871651 RepID=A0A1I0XGY9_9RHOB|nr:hypothetical protein [Poseidonocella pacifica]SFB00241.1 hypothetical protein SAMN05421688_2263 [Poseidonocella pacifica]